MRFTDEDIEMVFSGLVGASTFQMYGITTDGDVVELYKPESVITSDRQILRNFTADFATIGDDLYFTNNETRYGAGSNRATGFNVGINRLTAEGKVESMALLTDMEIVGNATTGFNDLYVLALNRPTGALGKNDGDVFGIGADGSTTKLSNLVRDGAGVGTVVVPMGDELYYMADQQSPLQSFQYELWRRDTDGKNDFLYDPGGNGTISSIVEHDGKIWFTVDYFPITGIFVPELFHVEPDGTPQEVDLSEVSLSGYAYADVKVLEDRLFLYDAYGNLFEIEDDGDITSLINDGEAYALSAFSVLDGTIYAALESDGIYRIETDGSTTRLTGYETLPDFGTSIIEMVTVGDTLYFTGTGFKDDGFGGTEIIDEALWAMDTRERFTQLTEFGSAAPEIRAVGDLFAFTLDVPDPIRGSGRDETLRGTKDGEAIFGLRGDDLIRGLAGADSAYGGWGNDTLLGHAGNDSLLGGGGADRLVGGVGADFVEGGAGHDRLLGNAGNDTLWGGGGNDRIDGGRGDDLIAGGKGNDTVKGGSGNDTLRGQDGRDSLNGNAGRDTLEGGGGNDTLNGGADRDVLTGGAGEDAFSLRPGDAKDTLTDFENNVDEVWLDDDLWGGGMSRKEVLRSFLKTDGDDLVLDFGRDELRLAGEAARGLQVDDLVVI